MSNYRKISYGLGNMIVELKSEEIKALAQLLELNPLTNDLVTLKRLVMQWFDLNKAAEDSSKVTHE